MFLANFYKMKILLIFIVFNKIICLINGQKNSEVFKESKRFIVILDLSHGFSPLKLDVLKSDLIDLINKMNEIEEEVNLTLMTISQELKIIDTKDKNKLLREINELESNIGKKQPKLMKLCLELASWLIKFNNYENKTIVVVSKADYQIDELISFRKIINRFKNSANLVILNNPILENFNSKILVSNEQNFISSLSDMWENLS